MYKFTFIASLSVVLIGCKAPIQLSNTTIIEHFKQDFDFKKVPGNQVDFVGELLSTGSIATKFGDYISYDKGSLTKKDLFIDNTIGTEGVVIFTLSLIPFKKKPAKFDVSGTGHYDIINKKTHEIYYTSTFHFTECINCSDIGSLMEDIIEKDSSTLKLKFTQVAINQFDYPEEDTLKKGVKYSHVPKEPIEVHIDLIKQKKYGSKCFSINYGEKSNPHKHHVYFKGMPIGTLSITPPTHLGSRIIDLKNMNVLIRKYKKSAP